LALAVLFGPSEMVPKHLPLCDSGARVTCVVDGDTFWLDGVKVRITDIDTPEVSDPLCAAEAALGARASFTELTADIVSAYVANNSVPAASLPDLIATIH